MSKSKLLFLGGGEDLQILSSETMKKKWCSVMVKGLSSFPLERKTSLYFFIYIIFILWKPVFNEEKPWWSTGEQVVVLKDQDLEFQ